MLKDYDNLFLPVHDLEKAKEFYKEVLGLRVKFDFSNVGMIAFKVGESEPSIILKDIAKFPDARPTIWFTVENVEAEYVKYKELGIRFISEPFPIATGMAVEFEDPFGNRLGMTDYRK